MYKKINKAKSLEYYKKGVFILSTLEKEMKPFKAQRVDHIRNKRDISDTLENLFFNHFVLEKELKRKAVV